MIGKLTLVFQILVLFNHGGAKAYKIYPDASNCFKHIQPKNGFEEGPASMFYNYCIIENPDEDSLSYKVCVLKNLVILIDGFPPSKDEKEKHNILEGDSYLAASDDITIIIGMNILGIPDNDFKQEENKAEARRINNLMGKCSKFNIVIRKGTGSPFSKMVSKYEGQLRKLVACVENAVKC